MNRLPASNKAVKVTIDPARDLAGQICRQRNDAGPFVGIGNSAELTHKPAAFVRKQMT